MPILILEGKATFVCDGCNRPIGDVIGAYVYYRSEGGKQIIEFSHSGKCAEGYSPKRLSDVAWSSDLLKNFLGSLTSIENFE